jgi:hypothetical protein
MLTFHYKPLPAENSSPRALNQPRQPAIGRIVPKCVTIDL